MTAMDFWRRSMAAGLAGVLLLSLLASSAHAWQAESRFNSAQPKLCLLRSSKPCGQMNLILRGGEQQEEKIPPLRQLGMALKRQGEKIAQQSQSVFAVAMLGCKVSIDKAYQTGVAVWGTVKNLFKQSVDKVKELSAISVNTVKGMLPSASNSTQAEKKDVVRSTSELEKTICADYVTESAVNHPPTTRKPVVQPAAPKKPSAQPSVTAKTTKVLPLSKTGPMGDDVPAEQVIQAEAERLRAEAEAAAEALRLEREAEDLAEAEAAAKRQEEELLAAEEQKLAAEAKTKAEEEQNLAVKAAAKAEEAKIAAEAEAAAEAEIKKQDERRMQDEAAKKAEDERLAAEEKRLQAELVAAEAEAKRIEEQQLIAKAAAEELVLIEEEARRRRAAEKAGQNEGALNGDGAVHGNKPARSFSLENMAGCAAKAVESIKAVILPTAQPGKAENKAEQTADKVAEEVAEKTADPEEDSLPQIELDSETQMEIAPKLSELKATLAQLAKSQDDLDKQLNMIHSDSSSDCEHWAKSESAKLSELDENGEADFKSLELLLELSPHHPNFHGPGSQSWNPVMS
mmetsp:Transcript_48278/g.75405  ORF Transcript_48278/g.75405 Transcript_48278/m.75405 type:complete len:571 (+) Transcript_48278:170-1882(+)